MIRSQSFHGPLSLGCDRHNFFFFFTFSSLGEMEIIHRLELGCPSPKVNKVLVKYFCP